MAHECIIDLRQIRQACGVTVEDVAKRLVDYGFHAPTMSWPVPDTMMIEPTESEAKGELDRFCDAMIAIRAEIAAIERGEADATDNPLRNAPHTADLLIAEWTRPYSREAAFFPVAARAREQVLAAGRPRRQRLRRSQPDLLLPARGRLSDRRGIDPAGSRGRDLQ